MASASMRAPANSLSQFLSGVARQRNLPIRRSRCSEEDSSLHHDHTTLIQHSDTFTTPQHQTNGNCLIYILFYDWSQTCKCQQVINCLSTFEVMITCNKLTIKLNNSFSASDRSISRAFVIVINNVNLLLGRKDRLIGL